MNKIKQFLPGVIICVGVAVLSKILAIFLPTLGAATLSIFLGIFLGNTFLKHERYSCGTKFSESTLLEYSVVLLGGTITFQTISVLGISGFLFIILQMTGTILCAIFIGRKLKFSENITLLMASGNAVCGSSAVAATAPVLDADEEEVGLVITIVNLTGTLLMLLLPVLSYFLYNYEHLKTSALIGGILQSVGQVVASGSMVNSQVLTTAMIFKIMRILMLVVIVYLFGRYKTNETANKQATGKKSVKIPWYVIGFFIICLIGSLGFIPEFLQNVMHDTSGWFEIIALAGIGLRLNLADLIKQGSRFALYGLGIGVSQILIAVTLISIFFH